MAKRTRGAAESVAVDKAIALPAIRGPSKGASANELLDRRVHAAIARLTGGVSPYAIAQTLTDWAMHNSRAPGRQLDLLEHAVENTMKVLSYWQKSLSASDVEKPFPPGARDPRFRHPKWEAAPYAIWQQGFLASVEWWNHATRHLHGLSPQDTERMAFMMRQTLDMVSPSNFPWMNPEIVEKTVEERGSNLVTGAAHFVEDFVQTITQSRKPPPKGHVVGKDLARTPGKVVFRNEIMELIQYDAQTPKVQAEPVLIVPAWIMKYYVLDLSLHNSFINYMVQQGFTVFAMSWVNPSRDQAALSLEDYRKDGVMTALDVIGKIVPDRKVHANGYCLGGTILAIAAATMARDGDDRLATVTLMAGQVDFAQAGELLLFLDESQVAFLEDMMWDQGYLDRPQMTRTFATIRAEDLIYTRAVRRYYLGMEDLPTDLGVWNNDTTRMPARMHGEYLRGLFLENRLTAGRFAVNGKVIALKDISAPMFAVGTETDHIAPWHSVYKVALFTDNDLTFVLASSGHNTGIVSEPGHPRRHYRIGRRDAGAIYVGPEEWLAGRKERPGSWWPEWVDWLHEHGSGDVAPPEMGAPAAGLSALCNAPGTYVHMT